ncbi:inositol monophosphatase family protein [Streptomyces sp. NPDC058086]|uniref:inositol monophosphatase family protein n=1 Tax=Streptomyces sp. NPDC058086 TaxID=3346334 RepID=UPI0036E2001D
MDYAFDAPPADRELLDFAVRLISRAGQVSVKGFFGDWHSRRKEDGSEVTEVDEAVEELIRAELGRRVPEDGVFGEEGGATSGTSGRRWVIDPPSTAPRPSPAGGRCSRTISLTRTSTVRLSA